MREGRDNGFEFGDDGLIALNMGSDHVAEHETGIREILNTLGVPTNDKVWGLKRRVITKAPEGFLLWMEGHADKPQEDRGRPKRVKCAGFHLSHYGEAWMPKMVSGKNGLYTTWAQNAFAAYSVEEKGISRLRELYDAFEVHNVAIWLGGGAVFQNPGLVLAIATRLPPKVLADWLKYDEAQYHLKEDAKATGIEEKLKAAGKAYFALSPKRIDGKLMFWLNPMDQHLYNSGWFTVGELEQWTEGKWTVMKLLTRKGGAR